MIKFEVETLDGVEESHQSLYVKTEGGKYQLAVDGAVSKDKYIEFRDSNIEFKKKFDALDSDESKRKEEETRKNGEWEKLSGDLTKERDGLLGQIETLTGTNKTYEERDEARLLVLMESVPDNMKDVVGKETDPISDRLARAEKLATVKPVAPGPHPPGGGGKVVDETLSAKARLIQFRRDGKT